MIASRGHQSSPAQTAQFNTGIPFASRAGRPRAIAMATKRNSPTTPVLATPEQADASGAISERFRSIAEGATAVSSR